MEPQRFLKLNSGNYFYNNKRKLIGRIDEETEALKALCLEQEKLLQQKDEELSALKKQVMELTLTVNGYKRRLLKIKELSRL